MVEKKITIFLFIFLLSLSFISAFGYGNQDGLFRSYTVNSSTTNNYYNITGGGNFSPTDFQDAFNSNWTALDYDKWMYNQTTASTDGATNISYFEKTNFQTSWDTNLSGSNVNSNILGNATSGDGSTNETYAIWSYNQTQNSDNDWILRNSTMDFNFNDSKLSTTYYDATTTSIIKGIIDGGSLADTQHSDGNYDGNTFNFSEVAGSPGLDLRINFTGIDDFNSGVMRYKTNSLAGVYPIIQMWDYDNSQWNDFPPVGESLSFATIEQPVFASNRYIRDGVTQMRIYKASNGNTNNHYYVDWIAIAKGYGTPTGEEIDPYSIHTTKINNTQMNYTDILSIKQSWLESLFYTRTQIDSHISGNASADGATNSSYEYWTNGSLTSTYNETYAIWSYNQTTDSSDGSTNSSYFLKTNFDTSFNNNLSNSINTTQMTFTDNILTILESWLKSLFYTRSQVDDYITGNSSADGSTNSSYEYWTNRSLDSTYNATYDTWLSNFTEYNVFWYNMTTSSSGDGSTNETYAIWSYNQSDGSTNSSYMTSITNSSYMTSITNSSYDYTAGSNLTLTDNKFSLNTATLKEWLDTIYATIGSFFSKTDFQDAFNSNITNYETRVNNSFLSTYNETYAIWSYNQSDGNDGADGATNSSYMTSITNSSYMTSITNSSYFQTSNFQTSWDTNLSGSNVNSNILGNVSSSSMDYTNIALTNISNTFAENQTLSESLVLSESKYIQMGVGYMLYNGTCMNMKGSTSTLSIC